MTILHPTRHTAQPIAFDPSVKAYRLRFEVDWRERVQGPPFLAANDQEAERVRAEYLYQRIRHNGATHEITRVWVRELVEPEDTEDAAQLAMWQWGADDALEDDARFLTDLFDWTKESAREAARVIPFPTVAGAA